jgi:ATP-binding cassette subfamily B (MDR/TAP) protein 1
LLTHTLSLLSLLRRDEGTSALDSKCEEAVMAALLPAAGSPAARKRTTILIAHRLSSVQRADVIIVFGAGRVLEQGTHAELLARGGAYAELLRAQGMA